MHKGFLLLVFLLFSSPFYAQDFAAFETKIKNLKDSNGIYNLYSEVKASGLSSEGKMSLAKALESKADEYGHPQVQGLALDLQALEYRNQGDMEAAFRTFDRASEVLMASDNISGAAWVDFDIAVTYYSLAQFDQSMEVITRNLEATRNINPSQYNTLLRAAGEILRGANRLDRAADYLIMATEHARETERQDALAYNLNRLGVVYYQDSKHDLAKEALEESLKLAQEIDLDRAITMNLNDMGELYFALKDYERCIELYEIALAREMGLGDKANTYNNVARLYWELDRYSDAIRYAQQALEIGQEISTLPHIMDAQKILADSYNDSGQYSKSAAFYQDYIVSKDSLFKLETQRQLADAETKYETAKKEQEIANLLEQEALERSRKQAYRNGLITAGVLLAVVLLLVWQISKNKKKIESQNKELGTLNATKDKFFSIIAHDLRSPMIGLQGVGQKLEYFIRKNKQEKLLEMGSRIDQSIDQLNHLLNNLLNWAASQVGSIPHQPQKTDLVALVNENVKLYESLAESKEVKVSTVLNELTAHVDADAISTVIRNILSNAIKFTKPGGEVEIASHITDGFSKIIISDQGEGIEEQRLERLFSTGLKSTRGTSGEKGFGLGLKLSKEFVDKNGGHLAVKSTKGVGTAFTISLPRQVSGISGQVNPD